MCGTASRSASLSSPAARASARVPNPMNEVGKSMGAQDELQHQYPEAMAPITQHADGSFEVQKENCWTACRTFVWSKQTRETWW